MRTCMRLEGYSDSVPSSFGKSTHYEYECYVTYDSHQDHEALITDFLKTYMDVNVENERYRYGELYCDRNYAYAMVQYALREQWIRFHLEDLEYIAPIDLPDSTPLVDSGNYSVWVLEKSREDRSTEKSAAWELYMLCQSQKLSTAHAKLLVEEMFPENNFYWERVLRYFSEYGGRYTDKYLRVDL